MDAIDISILNILKYDGRATASDVGRRVSLSVPAAAERIRKLEHSGVIERYAAKISRESLGIGLLAFVLVTVGGTERIEGFIKAAVKLQPVLECHHVAGEYDYLLKVAVPDAKALDAFLTGELKKIDGVLRSNTIVVLGTLKEEMNP
jgi:Lrp/AsnC family leucine-responsive transcriptional regulator